MSGTVGGNEDSLEALLSRLMATPPHSQEKVSDVDEDIGASPGTSLKATAGRYLPTQENDPWRAISDQIDDEISRQIFDELDKQLDAQLMAELEKCQEEQTRQLDEELDRQLQEQLDAMLEASLGSEAADDDAYGMGAARGQDPYLDDDFGYSSDEDDEEEYLESLPWSEGGEGGIAALGLRQVPFEAPIDHDHLASAARGTGGTISYTEEELQRMIESLYGEGGGAGVSAPGAWGRAKWRPGGKDDSS